MFRRSSVFDEGRMKRFRSANSAGLTEMNYWGSGADGSVTISANTTWDSTSSGDMIVKNFADFTVNSGVTLTIKARKGCLIYVKGNFVNNGTIRVQSGYSCDPSSAGVLSTGLRIIRVKNGSSETLSASDLTGCGSDAINAEANQNAINGNGKIYIISRTGASGGSRSAATNQAGVAGSNGSLGATLQTGGGGSGGTGGSENRRTDNYVCKRSFYECRDNLNAGRQRQHYNIYPVRKRRRFGWRGRAFSLWGKLL